MLYFKINVVGISSGSCPSSCVLWNWLHAFPSCRTRRRVAASVTAYLIRGIVFSFPGRRSISVMRNGSKLTLWVAPFPDRGRILGSLRASIPRGTGSGYTGSPPCSWGTSCARRPTAAWSPACVGLYCPTSQFLTMAHHS